MCHSPTALNRLLDEWTELYLESGMPNPFAHPLWVSTWLKHYTDPSQLFVVTVRCGEQLVAVAPFYRRKRFGRLLPSISLQLAGTGTDERLTEFPEIVVAGHPVRKVLRELIGFLLLRTRDWDWANITLGAEQGWFEPEWIPAPARARGAKFLHKETRASVIVDLPPNWDRFREILKRNMKESIRRSTNRLASNAGQAKYVLPKNQGELSQALDVLLRLHRLRAGVTEREPHADCFGEPRDEAFMRDVVGKMYEAGCASVPLLRIGEDDAAARLILKTNGATFFSFSGLDPAYWHYGPGTALMVESMRAAIARGDTRANLSQHPEDSKLRWSERLELQNEFLLVGPRRYSRAVFSAYLQMRALRQGHGVALNR